MTLSNCIQACSYAAQISRVITEAIQYNVEPAITSAPLQSRINTIAKYSILTLEFVRCLPLDSEAKKQLLRGEVFLRGTKALTGLAVDPRPLSKQSSTLSELAAIARNSSEYSALQSLELEKLSPEELAAKKYPIYAPSSSCYDDEYEPLKVIGSKSKTLEEVRVARQGAETGASLCGIIETALRGLAIHEEFIKTGTIAIPAAAIVAPGPETMFDFLNFNTIPEELHNDRVLSQYVDAISLIPIRFAMTHRRNPLMIYERASTQAYINNQLARGVEPLCPITRAPLTHDDLIPSPATQAIIDARLRKLSTQLHAQFAADLDAAAATMP